MSIQAYLDDLFREPSLDTSKSSLEEWTAFLKAQDGLLRNEAILNKEDKDDDELWTEPFPTVLDYRDHSEDEVENGDDKLDLVTEIALENPSLQSQSSSGSLADRVRRHLTTPSTYSSLMSLLSSPRSDEDIQLELVEIMGFEGDALTLVEELLKPGGRASVLKTINGASEMATKKQVSVTASTSRPPQTYLPSAQLTFTASKGRNTQRGGKQVLDLAGAIGTNEDIERRIEEQLNRPKAMFAEDGIRNAPQQVFPHVYTSGTGGVPAMSYGGKLALPVGTEREMNEIYEEVIIPPSLAPPPKRTERPVMITSMSPLARGCFPGYTSLNRMQSIVQPTAMNTNENMLICAPTGAGKTDVAIMSILRVIQHHVTSSFTTHSSGFNINRDAFKIIYVAPMKALAAEITRKFGKRLAWLSIKVRELTGDMQLTRQEIAETQIIVTTPEKWDVVTRKPTGEGELASKVQLLIIDEVHLLNEDRGAVIETIVARTLRQVESSQSLIRIVGLSATLPNYVDVADFLRVNRYQGLFFFDASFRPVPLEQHFIGVRGKPRSSTAIRNMDRVVFDKVSDLVRQGHQVMVFVHARKETVKTAQKLKEMAQEEGMLEFFDASLHPKYQLYRRDIGTSRNKEMKELFDLGFGIHHAGMLRSDRNMMERMFEDNSIKVLCCTSTLAWGVNLPAHAVVIKGTQVYDSGKGSFVDLSVLDVLQIFGRAGRPGYETSGEGYICTTQDKLDHYLDAIMAQHPIESKFIPGMVDSLNAEISLGTIANVQEAIQWIGYTYLFVRMRREPFVYGMSHDEPKDDPQLGNKRNQLVTQAARQLSAAKMIRFDELNNALVISDLGRIAAKYYLRHQTVEIFNKLFHPKMQNADLFAMLAQSTEFDQIQVRDNEIEELTTIRESKENCPLEVKGGALSREGKVNILLQAHISKIYIEDFALVSDAAYVAQNAGRIIRALLEIALSRKWANCVILLVDLSKAIEKRMWPYDHPLLQIDTLRRETLFNLRRWAEDTSIEDLREMEPSELGTLVHMNEDHGAALRNAALMFPTLKISHALRPLAHDLLQITVNLEPQFKWNTKLSGTAEPFYVWVQDHEGYNILQWRSILLRPTNTTMEIDFVIPFNDTNLDPLAVVSASDRWLGSDNQTTMSLENLVMPSPFTGQTPLLDIPYLSISCLNDRELERSHSPFISTLNGIQTQAFWSAYHTQGNTLISAPVSGGKSFLGEAAIWHAFRHNPDALVLLVVPRPEAVGEVLARIRTITPRSKKISVTAIRSAGDFEDFVSSTRQISIVSPRMLHQVDNDKLYSGIRNLSLVVLEDLHLLDDLYELSITKILSIVKPEKIRLFGITSSLDDPSDLATWLGVDVQSRYCFFPRDRGKPIIVSLKTFSTPHSATLLKTMIKPTYDILKSSTGSALLFVPSRSNCRSVASDLVTQSGTEMDLNGFLNAPRIDVEPLLQNLRDPLLSEPLLHGIGYIMPSMSSSDFALVLELFASGVIRALIAPREACWTLPMRAETVILLGAQYTQVSLSTSDPTSSQTDRQVQNYSREELVKMQGFAVTPSSTSGRMFIMCQSEQQTAISRILNDGLPLESKLSKVFRRSPETSEAVEVLSKMLKTRPPPLPYQHHRPRVPDLRKRDLMDLISWTYLYHRIKSNPTFYDIQRGYEAQDVSRSLIDPWFEGMPGEGNGEVSNQKKGKRGQNAAPDAIIDDEEVIPPTSVPGVRQEKGQDILMTETNRELRQEEVNVFEIDEVEIGMADGEAL